MNHHSLMRSSSIAAKLSNREREPCTRRPWSECRDGGHACASGQYKMRTLVAGCIASILFVRRYSRHGSPLEETTKVVEPCTDFAKVGERRVGVVRAVCHRFGGKLHLGTY
jgi:hypothetical protein